MNGNQLALVGEEGCALGVWAALQGQKRNSRMRCLLSSCVHKLRKIMTQLVYGKTFLCQSFMSDSAAQSRLKISALRNDALL